MSTTEQTAHLPRESQRSLSEIVESIVAEIRFLAALVDGCHSIPAPRVEGGAVHPEFIRQMQTADRINQRLDGLADFLSELRNTMPPDWRLNTDAALRIIKVHTLAQQLGLSDERPEPKAESADCHFF